MFISKAIDIFMLMTALNVPPPTTLAKVIADLCQESFY